MAYVQQPCACGGTSFQVLPDLHVHYGTGTGIHLLQMIAVVCIQCTRTELFTGNVDQIITHVKGARMIQAGQR